MGSNETGARTTAYYPKFDKWLGIPNDAELWDSGMFSETGNVFDQTFEVVGVYEYMLDSR